MKLKELEQQIESLSSAMDDALALLKARRYEESTKRYALEDAKVRLDRAQEALAVLHRQKTIAIASAPEWQGRRVDPRTNELSAEWSQLLIDHDLNQDSDFAIQLGKYYEAQQAVLTAQKEYGDATAATLVVADELGALKSRAFMVGASAQYASSLGRVAGA